MVRALQTCSSFHALLRSGWRQNRLSLPGVLRESEGLCSNARFVVSVSVCLDSCICRSWGSASLWVAAKLKLIVYVNCLAQSRGYQSSPSSGVRTVPGGPIALETAPGVLLPFSSLQTMAMSTLKEVWLRTTWTGP